MKSLFKSRYTYWEIERLPDGKWMILDPSDDDGIHIVVPNSWVRKFFEPVTGGALLQVSERVKHGPFNEN